MNPMLSTFRTATLIGALLLSACSAMDDPVNLNTLERLNGEWQQADGRATVHFYPDESVKLTMPEEVPPLRVLSVVENMKDNQIGFSIGDRWSGPITIRPAADWQSLELIFPGDEEKIVRFNRPRP